MNLQTPSQVGQPDDICDIRGLSPNAYVDQTFFEAEKRTIFRDRWCSIGFESAIPEPGDLKPIEFLELPLLIARAVDGEVKVFHNACPHRGTQLISEECNKKLIVCPYHAWSFEMSGEVNKFVAGKMFFVKFGNGPRDPVWPIDIFLSQSNDHAMIFGYLLNDAIEGFPVPLYPRSLQKAHENAALVDFDMDILQDMIFGGLRTTLGKEAPALDVFRLQDTDPASRRYE